METPDKSALRSHIREILRAFPATERQKLSGKLCAVLRERAIWRNAKAALLFAPLADEPDITPLLKETASPVVALPRYNSASGSYEACAIANRANLVSGRFGVLEPGADCPVVPLNQLDLVLVPGLAFDLAGRRLGRGKGFYDRLLAQVRGHKCGVALDAQIVSEVPEEPHDVRVDSILTPTRWHFCPRVD